MLIPFWNAVGNLPSADSSRSELIILFDSNSCYANKSRMSLSTNQNWVVPSNRPIGIRLVFLYLHSKRAIPDCFLSAFPFWSLWYSLSFLNHTIDRGISLNNINILLTQRISLISVSPGMILLLSKPKGADGWKGRVNGLRRN